MKAFPALLLALLAFLLAGCRPATDAPPAGPPAVETASVGEPVPAGTPSGQPRFFRDGDRLGLSWVEREGETATLRFATWEGGSWGGVREAARGDDWFVNWADTPGVAALGEDAYAAFYLQRTGEGRYDYAVRVVRSEDGGRTWSAPLTPHREDAPAEYGFVSAFPEGGGTRLIWLDGAATVTGHAEEGGDHEGGHGGAMALRTAVLHADGSRSDEALLDDRTCDCCPTAMARTASGLIAAYRDRSPDEVRDIAVVRLEEGTWTAPSIPHEDNWEIAGCPVNGPALAAEGDRVALAWFTGAEGARVQVALSEDGGRTFGEAVRVDDGHPIGRVDVAWSPDGRALVSWLEHAEDTAELRVRSVSAGGETGAAVTAAEVVSERSSGMPRLAVHEGEAWLGWVDAAVEGGQVRLARLPLEAVPTGSAVAVAWGP